MSPSLDSFQAGRQIGQGGSVSGVSAGLDVAFSAWLQKLQEKRQMHMEERKAALSTVFEDDPSQAYSVLGMKVPAGTDTSTPTAPAGTKLSEQQVKRGKTVSTFKAPEGLDAGKIVGLYSEYLIKSKQNEANDQFMATMSKGKYKPAPILGPEEWFQHIAPLVASLQKPAGEQTTAKPVAAQEQATNDQSVLKATEWLQRNKAPVTDANIKAVIKKFKLNGG